MKSSSQVMNILQRHTRPLCIIACILLLQFVTSCKQNSNTGNESWVRYTRTLPNELGNESFCVIPSKETLSSQGRALFGFVDHQDNIRFNPIISVEQNFDDNPQENQVFRGISTYTITYNNKEYKFKFGPVYIYHLYNAYSSIPTYSAIEQQQKFGLINDLKKYGKMDNGTFAGDSVLGALNFINDTLDADYGSYGKSYFGAIEGLVSDMVKTSGDIIVSGELGTFHFYNDKKSFQSCFKNARLAK